MRIETATETTDKFDAQHAATAGRKLREALHFLRGNLPHHAAFLAREAGDHAAYGSVYMPHVAPACVFGICAAKAFDVPALREAFTAGYNATTVLLAI